MWRKCSEKIEVNSYQHQAIKEMATPDEENEFHVFNIKIKGRCLF